MNGYIVNKVNLTKFEKSFKTVYMYITLNVCFVHLIVVLNNFGYAFLAKCITKLYKLMCVVF